MLEWQCGPPDVLVDEVVPLALSDPFKTGTQGFVLYDESDPELGAV
jgi:hypothetical protein